MENVKHDLKVIEEDLEVVEKKCEKVNCYALYEAIIATIKRHPRWGGLGALNDRKINI